MALLAIVAGFFIPIQRLGADVPVIVIAGAIAFVAGLVMFMFARGTAGVAAFFAILLAGTVWFEGVKGFQTVQGEATLTWGLYAIAGSIVGGNLRPDRKRADTRKKSGAFLVQWKDGRKLLEDKAPSADSLAGHLNSLDGKKKALVCAMRGHARMDFCGDANGAMVVYFSPDTSDDKWWSMLSTPGVEQDQIDVAIGDLEGSFASWETTTLDPAVVAARHFAATAKADPQLTWYASKDVCERRPLAS